MQRIHAHERSDQVAVYTSYEDALAAYRANADWREGAGDVAKAETFRSAIESMLGEFGSASQGQARADIDHAALQKQKDAVDAWLDASSSARGAARASFVPARPL